MPKPRTTGVRGERKRTTHFYTFQQFLLPFQSVRHGDLGRPSTFFHHRSLPPPPSLVHSPIQSSRFKLPPHCLIMPTCTLSQARQWANLDCCCNGEAHAGLAPRPIPDLPPSSILSNFQVKFVNFAAAVAWTRRLVVSLDRASARRDTLPPVKSLQTSFGQGQ